MSKENKHIITELTKEETDLIVHFREHGGWLFILDEHDNEITDNNWLWLDKQAREMKTHFIKVNNKRNELYDNYKEVLEDYRIDYHSNRVKECKAWVKRAEKMTVLRVCEFVNITEDYVELRTTIVKHGKKKVTVIYDKNRHTKDESIHLGKIALGQAREFSVKRIGSEDYEEEYGYIVVDGQVENDKELKRLICKQAGIKVGDTVLRMLDNDESEEME